MTCPSCGLTVPADARFCSGCGHTLVSRPDERRVATVLFADLVGYTSFSETADPEQVKNLVDRCFARLANDITTFGGQVDKVIGDALVALFGAPITHEDDAERAVRAALRMQEHLVEMRAEAGLELQMRVGVNTGEVLVGALRAGGDYTAMGDVVNTASRLQAIAQPGQVVVGASTHAAASRGVRYEPLGTIAVKGREEPVEAFIAVEAVAPPGQRRERARMPLVGRDEELAMLSAALTTTLTRRRAHFVLIAGEAGVGKTRLAAELGSDASCNHAARVLTGHCIPYGETNVWWPIGAMVSQACDVAPDAPVEQAGPAVRAEVQRVLALADDDAETGRVAEGLLYLMGVGGPGDDVDPTRALEDALRAALAFLGGLAAEGPLVLVLSDLHWADEQLLEFLPRLLARVAANPVILAATTRAELVDHWSPPPGRHNTMQINLEPLDSTDAAALLCTLLPNADPELRDLLRERSGGNPFFIEELVAMVGEDTSASDSSADLPATLHGLVAARLDRLAPKERSTLEDAAVIGTSGPVALVELLGASRDASGHAEATLAILADKELLHLDDGEFEFRNELTREVAYGTLTKAERARRHGMLAKVLAEEGEETGRVDEVLDRLAYHFNEAASLMAELGPVPGLPNNLVPRAIRFLSRAAERAEQRENWPTAERYLGHTLKLVENDHATELPLRVSRARARAEQRDLAGARRDLTLVFALAASLDAPEARATGLTIMGDVEYKEGDLVASAATLEQAVAEWRALDDPRGLAEALRFRGMTDVFRGELDLAVTYIEEALALFRSIEDRRGEAWGLQNLAWIAFQRGRHAKAEARLTASATAFGELGDWGGVAWALGLLAWVHFTQGKLEEAHSLATQILRESEELGNRWAGAIMQVLLSNIALWRGESESALKNATEARETFIGLSDSWGELQALTPLVQALNVLGRGAEAMAALEVLEEVATHAADAGMRRVPTLLRVAILIQRGSPDALPLAEAMQAEYDEEVFISDEQRTTFGIAQLQHGDVIEALITLSQARSIAGAPGPNAAASVAYASALVAAGQPEEALEICTATEPIAVTFVDAYRLQIARAFALARTGDPAGAEDALDAATKIVDGTQSRLDQCLVRVARAAYLTATNQPATAAAADALERAGTLGYRPIGWERTYALMAGTPG